VTVLFVKETSKTHQPFVEVTFQCLACEKHLHDNYIFFLEIVIALTYVNTVKSLLRGQSLGQRKRGLIRQSPLTSGMWVFSAKFKKNYFSYLVAITFTNLVHPIFLV
jgi:hypothetical protein